MLVNQEKIQTQCNSENQKERLDALEILTDNFSLMPDKQQAWADLVSLTNDKDILVRAYANYSLGKVSIIKAAQAEKEEDYRTELKNAIHFFEVAKNVSLEQSFNLSKFYLPFYNLLYILIFEQSRTNEEVYNYIYEAKAAIVSSKYEILLMEAVDYIAAAFKEANNLGIMDLKDKKGELNLYKKYFDRAEENLKYTEEKNLYATEVLRKGLPILNIKLKDILKEAQEKAKTTYQKSMGTPTQEIASAVNREVQKFEIGSQEEMTWYLSSLITVLKSKIPHSPENEKILGMIESMKYEKDITKQYRTLPTVIGLIPTVNVVPIEPVIEKLESSQLEILEEIRKKWRET